MTESLLQNLKTASTAWKLVTIFFKTVIDANEETCVNIWCHQHREDHWKHQNFEDSDGCGGRNLWKRLQRWHRRTGMRPLATMAAATWPEEGGPMQQMQRLRSSSQFFGNNIIVCKVHYKIIIRFIIKLQSLHSFITNLWLNGGPMQQVQRLCSSFQFFGNNISESKTWYFADNQSGHC